MKPLDQFWPSLAEMMYTWAFIKLALLDKRRWPPEAISAFDWPIFKDHLLWNHTCKLFWNLIGLWPQCYLQMIHFFVAQRFAVITRSCHWNPMGKHILAYIFAFIEPVVTELDRNDNRHNFNIWYSLWSVWLNKMDARGHLSFWLINYSETTCANVLKHDRVNDLNVFYKRSNFCGVQVAVAAQSCHWNPMGKTFCLISLLLHSQ